MDKYDRVMKKVYKFYDNPKVEETYALDYSLVRMIVPRLEMFIDRSSKIINWESHTYYAKLDVIKTCEEIIEHFKFYLSNSDTDDIGVYRECERRLKIGFDLLGDVITHLGW